MNKKISKLSKKKGLPASVGFRSVKLSPFHTAFVNSSHPAPADIGHLLDDDSAGEAYRTEPLIEGVPAHFNFSGTVIRVMSATAVKTTYLLNDGTFSLFAVAVACPVMLQEGSELRVYGYIGRNEDGQLSFLCEVIENLNAKYVGEFDYAPCFPR